MIISQLNGGLGNQMFQYAVGRALSVKASVSLLLDLSALGNPDASKTYRTYGLDVFNIKAEFADKRILKNVKRESSGYGKFQNIFSKPKLRFIRETGFDYHLIEFNPEENICLHGYWQSEKYFSSIEDIIRRELSVKIEPDNKNKDLSIEISSLNSISLHIRRGDYINNPKTNEFHGVCSLDYYIASMKYIESRLEKPHYFVFSDDIDWCQANIESKHPITYVDNNTAENSYEDLRLMSLCKHNIIANSSFSWWGAWLNTYPQKIVIAPNNWFKDDSIDTKDLIPESWVRI